MMEQWIKRIKKNLSYRKVYYFYHATSQLPVSSTLPYKGVFKSALHWLMHFSLGVYASMFMCL